MQRHDKVKNRFFMKRGPLLPEFITVEGKGGRLKEIRTYETSIDRTLEPYINSMSKYLATIRVFPEFTPYRSKYGIGKYDEGKLKDFLARSDEGKWVKNAIDSVVGIGEYESTIRELTGGLSVTASISAAAGLISFIWHKKYLNRYPSYHCIIWLRKYY